MPRAQQRRVLCRRPARAPDADAAMRAPHDTAAASCLPRHFHFPSAPFIARPPQYARRMAGAPVAVLSIRAVSPADDACGERAALMARCRLSRVLPPFFSIFLMQNARC